MAMKRRSLLLVLSGVFVVFLAAHASGQSFEDPTKFYKNMTFEFDVRHRGEVGIPSCVRQLMECWDIIRADITCVNLNTKIFYETACSVMRNQRCNEFAPFGVIGKNSDSTYPYDRFHIFEQYCPAGMWGYWTRRRRRLPAHALGSTSTAQPTREKQPIQTVQVQMQQIERKKQST